VTLIELLAAVTITVIVVSSISTLFPKASSAIAANRQRLVATQLAQALVQQAKRSPYALLDPTAETAGPAADFPTNGTGTGPGKCDCNTANFFVLAGSATVVVNNIAYSQSTCVNYFEPINLQTYCPSALGTANLPADPGLKTVHVRVWWSVSASTITIDMASKVARL
jgi:type II secretory pathway pseudopilin PulG